jgi:hypothetical protein
VTVVISFFVAWLPFHLQRVLSIILLEAGENANTALQSLFTAVFYVSGTSSHIRNVLFRVFFLLEQLSQSNHV